MQALAYAIKTLGAYSSSPALDSKLLLMHILQMPLNKIHAGADIQLTLPQQQQLEQYLQRRKEGEPIAYIIAEAGFWDLILHVTPDVLIPRPETELLVDTILSKFKGHSNCKMCELGTGSGAISIAIGKTNSDWQITATDLSDKALEVAAKNLHTHNTRNVTLVKSNWFDNIEGEFDIIVSNPPYIAEDDPHLKDLTHEPQQALTSPENGAKDLRHIIEHAKSYLVSNGMLLLEHGYAQQDLVCELLKQASYNNITRLNDLAGLPRATCAILR